MKVGLVRRGYSRTGGAESYLKRFAEALTLAGHSCVLFASEEWPRDSWPFGEMRQVPGGSPRVFADALEALRPREQCDFLFSLERVWSCDCYRAGDGVHRAWLERRAKYEPRWRALFRGANRKHRELLMLESKLFTPGATRSVIANSEMVRSEIVRLFNYPAERIHVIYNGIKPPPQQDDAALRDTARRELGLSAGDFVVLFAGSGWERKGLRFAIGGIDRVTAANPLLLVAGRGHPRSVPRSPRVRFLGPVQDIPRLLAAADVFLLPTIYDPFSNACLEALVAGLPVITTSANGFSEIIQPGVEGEVLSDPSDVDGIARAIERWSDRDKRAHLRALLAARAAQFDIETNVRKTLAVIEAQ